MTTPAGLDLRSHLPVHACRHRAARRRRRHGRRAVRRDVGHLHQRHHRHRRGLPAARRPRSRRPRGAGRLLRRRRVRGSLDEGQAAVRRRRRQLRRAGRGAPGAVRRPGDGPGARQQPRGEHVRLPRSGHRRSAQRAGPLRNGGRGRWEQRGTRPSDAALRRVRSRGGGARRRPVHPHRVAAGHRLAGRRRRPRSVGLHLYRGGGVHPGPLSSSPAGDQPPGRLRGG
ncbi:MAG: hypothetical protein JWP46_2585 [Modestobacter sp.]|nr:hypothetical protein [Modestobacter sp.]